MMEMVTTKILGRRGFPLFPSHHNIHYQRLHLFLHAARKIDCIQADSWLLESSAMFVDKSLHTLWCKQWFFLNVESGLRLSWLQ